MQHRSSAGLAALDLAAKVVRQAVISERHIAPPSSTVISALSSRLTAGCSSSDAEAPPRPTAADRRLVIPNISGWCNSGFDPKQKSRVSLCMSEGYCNHTIKLM